MSKPKFKSSCIAFSAPSGTGKTTIVEMLAKKYKNLVISVSATTRPIRPMEKNGAAYHFLEDIEFKKLINNDAFLEYEEVHGCFYGTLKNTVNEHVRDQKTVLFDIDVNGALAIKKRIPDAVLIFLKPPSQDTLVGRLKNRRSETEKSIMKRLQRLDYEYQQAEKFDFIVINDQLEDTIRIIEKIIIKQTL